LTAYADAWRSPESSGSKTWGTWAPARWLAERTASYVSTDGSARAYDVGACARLVPSLSAPRETSGPRIDRIQPARPPWWRRQYRELKKLFFSAPSKCPIDRFGPVANGTILKRLHVASREQSSWTDFASRGPEDSRVRHRAFVLSKSVPNFIRSSLFRRSEVAGSDAVEHPSSGFKTLASGTSLSTA